MKNLKVLFIAVCAAAALTAGCASHDSNSNYSNAQFGVVKSINPTTETSSGVNVGTLIGGVVGGLAGHQIGGGSGNTAATVVGAVGGAVIGTQVDKGSSQQMFKVGVRLQNGSFETVTQKGSVADLRVGQRVQIVNDQVQPV
jgi:outer membrane lipoprotein SlyB